MKNLRIRLCEYIAKLREECSEPSMGMEDEALCGYGLDIADRLEEILNGINEVMWTDIVKVGDAIAVETAEIKFDEEIAKLVGSTYLGDTESEILSNITNVAGDIDEFPALYDCDPFMDAMRAKYGDAFEGTWMFERDALTWQEDVISVILGESDIVIGGCINGVSM